MNNIPRPVIAYDIAEYCYWEFDSVKDAARKLGLDKVQIFGVLKGKYKTTKGYRFYDALYFYNNIYKPEMVKIQGGGSFHENNRAHNGKV